MHLLYKMLQKGRTLYILRRPHDQNIIPILNLNSQVVLKIVSKKTKFNLVTLRVVILRIFFPDCRNTSFIRTWSIQRQENEPRHGQEHK